MFTAVPELPPENPTRELAASRAPELHWKLALTRWESPPKIIF